MVSLIHASTTSQEYEKNINVTLKHLRHSYLINVIFSYLNINSIENTFGDLSKIVDKNIVILCIAKVKLDKSFRIISSYISIISLYILDISKNKVACWYLLNGTYLKEGLFILKFHLIYK